MKIGVVSTNEPRYLTYLLEGIKKGLIDAEIGLVITDNPVSKVIDIAGKNGLLCEVINWYDFENRREHDRTVMKKLDEARVDLVILGGYLRLIKDDGFLKKYHGKMINVHNSFLPNFPGMLPHVDAFNFGVNKTGYTIHFVDKVMDNGKIIFQEDVDISKCKNPSDVYDMIVKGSLDGLMKVVGMFDKNAFRNLLKIEDNKIK